jgi:hypothetical protein
VRESGVERERERQREILLHSRQWGKKKRAKKLGLCVEREEREI